MEWWIANLFFLEYIVLLCIWWYRAVQAGEFDWWWVDQIDLKGIFDAAKSGKQS